MKDTLKKSKKSTTKIVIDEHQYYLIFDIARKELDEVILRQKKGFKSNLGFIWIVALTHYLKSKGINPPWKI